jgi:threonine dehydrogenase-like Zn-dependent dehydrogenase
MRAVTVIPLKANTLELSDFPEPPLDDGPVLVKTRAIGVCGTDIEIISGEYGWAPPGIVRRPDPLPCINCAIGEWDMCRNGNYTEWGIKSHHGYARERYRITPDFLVKISPSLGNLGVLLEPTTVVAKAWDHIGRIGARAKWEPRIVLVTGAGPIGLLAALLGVQRGLEVHVLDQVTSGLKPDLVASIGATYHHGDIASTGLTPDIVVECTGVAQLVFDAMDDIGPNGILCLTGVSSKGRSLGIDAGELNRHMVLANDVVFGSVNANRSHYQAGADALAKADPAWLGRVVSRHVTLDNWQDAYQRQPGDVKVVLQFS